jgi:hypothetical protein
LLVLLAVASLVWAQSGPLEIPWFTIDGGGGVASTGGDFSLSGSVGQPDTIAAVGSVFGLRGGFWDAAISLGEFAGAVYLPLVLR